MAIKALTGRLFRAANRCMTKYSCKDAPDSTFLPTGSAPVVRRTIKQECRLRNLRILQQI